MIEVQIEPLSSRFWIYKFELVLELVSSADAGESQFRNSKNNKNDPTAPEEPLSTTPELNARKTKPPTQHKNHSNFQRHRKFRKLLTRHYLKM